MSTVWQAVLDFIAAIKTGSIPAIVSALILVLGLIFHGPIWDAVLGAYNSLKALWGG